MPDLPNRQAYEAEFASGIATALELQRRELTELGIERALQADWQKQQDDLAAILFLLLLRPWEKAFDNWNTRYGATVRPAERFLHADQWSRQHATKTAEYIVGKNRETVFKTAQKGYAGLTGQPAITVDTLTLGDLTFQDVSSVNRVIATAVSLVTDSVSGAEFTAADLFTRKTGLTATAYWFTFRDEKVCKTCEPLHGQPFDKWAALYPTGPSAHPRCRCYLTWVVGPRYSAN